MADTTEKAGFADQTGLVVALGSRASTSITGLQANASHRKDTEEGSAQFSAPGQTMVGISRGDPSPGGTTECTVLSLDHIEVSKPTWALVT